MIDYLDPNHEHVHHRLFREHCYLVPNGPYVKDLRILNRKLDKVVLIDNAAYSYAFQLENGIPIIPYYHGKNDFELSALRKYLEKLLLVDDVRKVNRSTFLLHHYRSYKSSESQRMVIELYVQHNFTEKEE